MILRDLIPLIKPETIKISLTDFDRNIFAEFYPDDFKNVERYLDYEVREISPIGNTWIIVSLRISSSMIPKKVTPGADPKDYTSSQLREFLLDGGVPESDIQIRNRRICIPATKWNKKLLDKWGYCHSSATMFEVKVDPRTQLPIFEIDY